MNEMKSNLIINSVVGFLLLLWFIDDIIDSLSIYPLDVVIFITIGAYTVVVVVPTLACSLISFLLNKIK